MCSLKDMRASLQEAFFADTLEHCWLQALQHFRGNIKTSGERRGMYARHVVPSQRERGRVVVSVRENKSKVRPIPSLQYDISRSDSRVSSGGLVLGSEGFASLSPVCFRTSM